MLLTGLLARELGAPIASRQAPCEEWPDALLLRASLLLEMDASSVQPQEQQERRSQARRDLEAALSGGRGAITFVPTRNGRLATRASQRVTKVRVPAVDDDMGDVEALRCEFARHRLQAAELNDLFLLLCYMEIVGLPNPATLYLLDDRRGELDARGRDRADVQGHEAVRAAAAHSPMWAPMSSS